MGLDKKYNSIVKDSAKAAAAAGTTALINPFLDTAAIAGIWTNMIIKIAKESGRKIDMASATKFITSVGAGVGAYKVGGKILGTAIWLIPGLGWLGAMGLNSTLNYLFTFRLGKTVASMFDDPSFDFGNMADITQYVVLPMLSIPTLREFREMA